MLRPCLGLFIASSLACARCARSASICFCRWISRSFFAATRSTSSVFSRTESAAKSFGQRSRSTGPPVTPDGSGLWAWPFELDGEFGISTPKPVPTGGAYRTKRPRRDGQKAGENTTIGVVATDAPLTVDAQLNDVRFSAAPSASGPLAAWEEEASPRSDLSRQALMD